MKSTFHRECYCKIAGENQRFLTGTFLFQVFEVFTYGVLFVCRDGDAREGLFTIGKTAVDVQAFTSSSSWRIALSTRWSFHALYLGFPSFLWTSLHSGVDTGLNELLGNAFSELYMKSLCNVGSTTVHRNVICSWSHRGRRRSITLRLTGSLHFSIHWHR